MESNFKSLLPISMRLFARTVSADLIPVRPIVVNSDEEMELIRQNVKIENRDRKIESFLEGKEFEPISYGQVKAIMDKRAFIRRKL